MTNDLYVLTRAQYETLMTHLAKAQAQLTLAHLAQCSVVTEDDSDQANIEAMDGQAEAMLALCDAQAMCRGLEALRTRSS